MSSQPPFWLLNQAEIVSPVLVDVGFLVQESLYTGPENEFTQEQWQNSRARLYQPNIQKYGHFALSSDVTGHEAELVRYYKDVIAKTDVHGKVLKKDSSNFWNRPILYSPDSFTFSFPWYDRLIEGRRLFDALSSVNCNGGVFSDIDQGWEVLFWRQDDLLYASEFDPDDETARQSFKFEHQAIKSQIAELIPRVERIISILSDELGDDYWS